MARTTFVNPFMNPRRRSKRKSKSRGRRRHKRSYSRAPRRRAHRRSRRRNAGITPFVQNPLILSNPRRRRRHRRNPSLGIPSFSKALSSLLTGGGGAAAALTLNTVALNKIPNAWLRRAAQAGAAIVGGAVISTKSQAMGHSYAGAQMYPLVQDLAADLLGVGASAAAATEADIDALAADLEDVLDEVDESDFDDDGDDDEEEAW